jgi:hypothetical protein
MDMPDSPSIRTQPLNPNYLLTQSLTHSMQHRLSSDANRPSASQKIPRILWNQRFITAFTSSRYWSLSRATSTQSMPPHPKYRRLILILSSCLLLGVPNSIFPSGFPNKTLYAPLLPPQVLNALTMSVFLI